jgi:hypothetical protein
VSQRFISNLALAVAGTAVVVSSEVEDERAVHALEDIRTERRAQTSQEMSAAA